MKRGRPRKPSATLKLAGTYRKDRHGEADHDFAASNGHMPTGLPSDAAKVWDRLAPGLIRNGLLTDLDAIALEVFCRECVRWQQLEKMVTSTGGPIVMIGGQPKPHPALRESQRARDTMLVVAREFGMTPAARRSVTMEPDKSATVQVAKIVGAI